MQEKLKNNKGITLIALVITIVIIIILSAIAINLTFGENGLITKAQQASEKTAVAQIQEQLEMAKGSAFIDGAGDIDPDHYFDILEEEGIIGDKDTDVEDNGDGSYDVTTDGDYVFGVTPTPDGDLEIEYVGKNDEPRISSINVTDKTDSSVTVEVVTKNVDNAQYTYSYKKTEEGEEAWQQAGSSSDSTFTISDLENNTSYDIKVTVAIGNTTVEKTITVQIGTGVVEIPDNTITFGQVVWQGDGTANMPISTTESGYTLQYQVDSTAGQWTTITSGQSITGLKHGNTVYARLTDGTDTNTSEIQQTTVEDKILPEVSVTSTGNTSNSISVSVSVNDKESGMVDNPTYTYYIKQSESADYVAQATDITENTYTFNNLQSGVSHDIKVEVKSDKAGNMGTGYLAGQTTTSIPGGSGIIGKQITVSDTAWADGKASITVSTSSEYNIEYQVNGTPEESWTNIGNNGTVPNLNYGDTVNIRLTDGANHGNFATVTIGDEIDPTVNVSLSNSTSNSIAVSVSATDVESGMSSNPVYTYYIKESSEPEESYEAPSGATELASSTYTFAGLKQSTSYDIKVEVKADMAGNIGIGTLLNQTTKTIPSGEGETEQGITFGTPIWSDGQASITVSTKETEYSIEYKLSNPEEDSGWTIIENNGTIPNLEHGSTVYARLTDGNNHGDYAETTIKDEISPVVDVKLNGLTTSNSIPVSVTASDNESGIVASPTYTYYIKQSSEDDTAYKTQANSTNLTSNTYTFTGLTQGTSYDIKVEVTGDVAGNTGTGYLAEQTTQKVPDGSGSGVEEGAITFGTIQWASNKASITVNTNTSYQIEYKLSAPEEEEGWTGVSNGGTISNLSYGATVYARLTDGVNHGAYASASIDDKTAPQAANIKLSATSTDTDGSITATVTLADNESGVNITESKWIYNTTAGNIGTEEASYTNSFTENPEELTLSTDTAGTYYLHVLTKDLAGNKVETVSEAVTVEEGIYVDEVVASAPQVSGEMTPVKWNGSNWVKTDVNDSEWYNYAEKKWANIVLGDATFSGDILDESKAYSMLVWIPRYAYKITSQYHQNGTGGGNIEIVFVDTANQDKGGKTYSITYPSYSTESGMSDYVVHPAFDYGGKAIPGFWVGKYETSNTSCTTDKSTGLYPGTDRTVQIKAGVTSWRAITVSNIYTVCTEMNKNENIYGLDTDDNKMDPHMMKNSEWGAVAYLSQNKTYGKGSEVWINNSSTYITGNAGSSVSADDASEVTNEYKTTNGQQASTTGNVTGVYDMSGGAWEYVAGYVNNGNSTLTSFGRNLVNAADKYKDVYKVTSDSQSNNYNNAAPTVGQGAPTVNTGRYGDAVWETSSSYNSSSSSWYGDYSDFPSTVSPFFKRGGGYDGGSNAGMFGFDYYNGIDDGSVGFRVVVPVL